MEVNKNNLLEGDIRTTFFQYLLPCIGSMLGNSLYILGDTIMVGQALGAPGLSAVNLSIPLLKAANSIGLIFGVGGATALSVSRGRGDYERGNKIFNLSIYMGVFLGAILTFISLFFTDQLVWMLGATDFSFEMTKTYLQLVMATSIPTVLSISLGIFIRNDGSANLPMVASLVSTLFNLVFDYILIFPMGLGIWGGALATALSPIVSIAILSLHFFRGKNELTFEKVKIDFDIVKRIFSNGFPSALIEMSLGMVILVFNKVILSIEGDLGVSAYSIIANLSLVFISMFNGMGQAIQPIVSINYGAGKMDRVYEATRLGANTAFVSGLGFFILGNMFPEVLASMFTSDKGQLLSITAQGIKLYSLAFLVMGLNVIVTSFAQSKEDARTSTIISLLRGSIYPMLMVFFLSGLIGIDGVWLSTFIAEILTILTYVLIFNDCRKVVKYIFFKKYRNDIGGL